LRGPLDRPAKAPLLTVPRPPPTARAPRGPFPTLRLAGDATEAVAATSGLLTAGLSDERHVITYAQSALRSGALSPSERGEAMLYQVVALCHLGQFAVASKLLGEIATQIDLPTLDGLLGPGGFVDLKARLTLRGGDYYQGMGLAQQALPLLGGPAALTLKNIMAGASTSKAIDMIERGTPPERVFTLLKNTWTLAHGGPPENLLRANYNLAILQLYRGKLADAKAALLRIDPQVLPEVFVGLGSYHDLLGDGRAAMDAYRRYLQTATPGDPQMARVQQWVDVLERVHGQEGVEP
jgi:hypothetical protein